MEFSFTPEQNAWRMEVREFMAKELATDYMGGEGSSPDPDTVEADDTFLRKLAAKGWLVLSWPKEYGGGGAGLLDQLIFMEELGYRRGPNLGPGPLFVGPSLIMHGTPDQQKQHLSAIAKHEVRWCQGFSEPGTGSDLANLQTRAVQDGDDFVVNGSKIWTTMAHRSQWCWLATRTNPDAPKHRGITLFMVPMDTPGITIRPVPNMAGAHSFNQVFFDDVRIPRTSMVGPQDRGWYVMTTTLDFERSVISTSGGARRTLEDLVQYANTTPGANGRPIGKDPIIASKLARMATEIEVARLFAYQTASVQLHGRVPNKEASICKTFNSEMTQRLAQTGMEIMGADAAVYKNGADGEDRSIHARILWRYLHMVAATIASGTSEIQRSIIATRGLGMPR